MDKPKKNSTSSNVENSVKGRSTDSPTVADNGVDDATSCLITPPPVPPNINIGRLYVYNFSPSPDGTTSIEIPFPASRISKYHSPATSSGPICRICHEGDGLEDLVSPCNCSGTVGLVHLTCVEKWLGLAGSDRCEICNYVFVTTRYPGTFMDWIKNRRTGGQENRRSLVSDLMCFCLLTPLAAVSGFLCIEGAMKQVNEGNSLEAGCLMALATFLITIFFVWNTLTFRFHAKNFLKWSALNQRVRVLRVSSLPHDGMSEIPNSTTQTSVQFSSESPNINFESVNSTSPINQEIPQL